MNSKKSFVAYASQYFSYLTHQLKEEEWENIKEVILFGSAARGEANKDSDIDIFINIFKENKLLEKRISNLTTKFYDTEIFQRWKLLGIKNEIQPTVGVLSQWKQLRPSIAANGLILFSKYKMEVKGKPQVLFSWQKITPESKRISISKKVYGYRYRNRAYLGLLGTTGGKKVASNCVLIPLEGAVFFASTLKKAGVKYQAFHLSLL